jgi:hypothetical protein
MVVGCALRVREYDDRTLETKHENDLLSLPHK